MTQNSLFTIGHSSRTIDQFVELLRAHKITLVVDVRSSPYSRYAAQFDRTVLERTLENYSVEYTFLGGELGGRPDNPDCYLDGRVQYRLVAKTDAFLRGIRQLTSSLGSQRLAIMCSEKDPITCHRMLLISHFLRSKNLNILHVIDNDVTEEHHDTERRMLHSLGLPELDLFSDFEELVEEAYDKQAKKSAFRVDQQANQAKELTT